MSDPVVQVIDEKNQKIVYTVRIKGRSYRPKVFAEGTYTVKIGEPGTNNMKTIKNLKAAAENNSVLKIELEN